MATTPPEIFVMEEGECTPGPDGQQAALNVVDPSAEHGKAFVQNIIETTQTTSSVIPRVLRCTESHFSRECVAIWLQGVVRSLSVDASKQYEGSGAQAQERPRISNNFFNKYQAQQHQAQRSLVLLRSHDTHTTFQELSTLFAGPSMAHTQTIPFRMNS